MVSHYFFQEDWLRESTNAESYLMDHDIARSMVFGVRNIDELAKVFPSMSLKTQGWLEKPSCPMLIVNGKADLQTPIEDLYILLEYGTPKSARVFPGRPHGPNARDPADHHALVEKGVELIPWKGRAKPGFRS